MADITVKEATALHAADLAPRMRDADVREVYRATGQEPLEVLMESIAHSRRCGALLIDGQTEIIFGAAETGLMGNSASIWMLMSERPVTEFKDEFKANAHHMVNMYKDMYDHLYNYVDVDNEVSIRWLKRMGFKFGEKPVPYGTMGYLFYRFDWRKI